MQLKVIKNIKGLATWDTKVLEQCEDDENK
jgi:hypothetical protein